MPRSLDGSVPSPATTRTGSALEEGGERMDDSIHTRIEELVTEEHELWQRESAGDAVQLHADLTMLARLSRALGRARAVPLAA